MSFVALSSFARNACSASRVGVGSALCVALNVTSTRFRSGFSFLCRTSSCIGYRSMRRKTSRALDFAASSARTTTTPWDGIPYRTAADEGEKVLFASDFDAYPLVRLKGFGDHVPRIRRDRCCRVCESEDLRPDPLKRLSEFRIFLTLRLEVDDADVGRAAASDEVEGAEVPDGHDGARGADRRQDARPMHEGAHRPTEILAQRVRESQRDVGELTERRGRISR